MTHVASTQQRLEELEREVRGEKKPEEPSPVAPRLVLGGPVAPVWQRAAALWLDLGAVTITGGAILTALWMFVREDLAAWLGRAPELTGLGLAILGVVYALHSVGEVLWDTTPGKRALGLAVRCADGPRVPWPRSVGRASVKSLGPLLIASGHLFAWPRFADLGLAVLVLLAFGGLLALGPDGAALHDRVFRTRVRLTHVLVRI